MGEPRHQQQRRGSHREAAVAEEVRPDSVGVAGAGAAQDSEKVGQHMRSVEEEQEKKLRNALNARAHETQGREAEEEAIRQGLQVPL